MNKIQDKVLSVLIVNLVLAFNCPLVGAADKDPEYIKDTSGIGQSEDGYIRSEQLLELGSPTPGALSIEGEQSLRQGSLDRALTVLQRAVELAPLDVDSRILYAETLEKKLLMQKNKKDPALFNFLVKQWFFVYQKSDYLDQKLQGLSHVIELTGTQPRRFERAQKFLSRVMIPEDGSVKVVIGGEKNAKPGAAKAAAKNAQIANKGRAHADSDLKEDKFE